MGKWEEINELEVEDPEDMVEFSVEDLTWTEIWGDQVAIIPYCRLQDIIMRRASERTRSYSVCCSYSTNPKT